MVGGGGMKKGSACLVPDITVRFLALVGGGVPHHPAVRDLAEGGEGVAQRLCVDLWTEVSDEDVVVLAGVLRNKL